MGAAEVAGARRPQPVPLLSCCREFDSASISVQCAKLIAVQAPETAAQLGIEASWLRGRHGTALQPPLF
jgi:hypothetical protein